MKHKRLVAAAAVTASIFGGAAGGALLFTPQLSGAQESTTTTAAPANGERHAGVFGMRGDVLATAATALGMSEADLRTALQGGKTIADVAKDKGVDVQKVIDALVAEGEKALQRAEADLPARVSDLVNGKLPVGGRDGWHRGRGMFGAGLDEAATALGMSEADLRTALQSGKSLADVAKDKGVDVQKVIDALVSAASERVDQAVTDGKLTTDQATQIKARLKDEITAFVNGQRPRMGERGFGGPGFRHDGMGPAQGQGSSFTS